MKRFIFTIILIFIVTPKLFATTNYVSLTGNHIPPFSTWADAATNIQDAVDAASVGDTVLVTNGTYYPADQIFVTNSKTVKSINGAGKTIVDGGFPSQTNRCFYLEKNTILDGFTVKNGRGDCSCWIIGSTIQAGDGGGIYCGEESIVKNCVVFNNYSAERGGGVLAYSNSIIQDCLIYGNSSGNECGGAFVFLNSKIQNCLIYENTSINYGGGAYLYSGSIIRNSIIYGNSTGGESGGIHSTCGSTIQNCLVYDNVSDRKAGAVTTYISTIINSTICKNTSVKTQVDGIFCTANSFIYNTIIYGHKREGLWFEHGFENYANRVKTLNTNTKNCWFGRPPGFIDIKNNDFRLSRKLPCINRGSTNYSKLNIAFPETDLAGNPRVMNGKIDIGAYEYNRDIFTKYIIKWNKAGKDKIIFKSKFKNFKQLGENLSVKIGNSFIVSNLEPFKVTTKVAKYKSDNPKCLAILKVKPDGILAKIKCLKLNKLDNVLNITNETVTDLWRDLDVEYFLGTNMFADKISTRYRSKKDKFCKGQKP